MKTDSSNSSKNFLTLKQPMDSKRKGRREVAQKEQSRITMSFQDSKGRSNVSEMVRSLEQIWVDGSFNDS